MTTVNENSIDSEVNQEASPSGRTEQDQEFSDRLEDLLDNVLNQVELSDTQSRGELSNIREGLEDLTAVTEEVKNSESGSDGTISIENIEEKVSDLTYRVENVESNNIDQTERDDLEERLTEISSYFETDNSNSGTVGNRIDAQLSGKRQSATGLAEDANPDVIQTQIDDDIDSEYFDSFAVKSSKFESLSNTDYADTDELIEMKHKLQEIAHQITCSDLSEDDDPINNDIILEVSSGDIPENVASDISQDSITGLESIEQQITTISSRVDDTEAQLGRIENIEEQVIQLVECFENSDQLPISELTDAIEQLKTDVNYNDQCTATTLKTISQTLDQLTRKIDAGDELTSDHPISESSSKMNVDYSLESEHFDAVESQNPEEQQILSSTFTMEGEETHLQNQFLEPADELQPSADNSCLSEDTPPKTSHSQGTELSGNVSEIEAETFDELSLAGET
ncbi:MAG: hypothetical protein ACR2PH_05745, partial [Desulfobulbia bacterium]